MAGIGTKIMEQGPRNVVIQFTNDGSVPENGSAALKVNVATLLPPCLRVDIERMKYSIAGPQAASLQMLWGATTPDLAWVFTTGDSGDINFQDVGGLLNPKSAGFTGNILFLASAAAVAYSVVLWLEKKQD